MTAQLKTDIGMVRISDNVVATVASHAVMEVYGVVGLTTNDADGIAQLLKRDNMAEGVVVHTDDDRLVLDLDVFLEYGVRIAIVAENIIDTVKFSVENSTGLTVDHINVVVNGIRV